MIKTIMLAEGEKHVREAVHLLFEQQADYEIICVAANAANLLAQFCVRSVDGILLDWNLPGFYPTRVIHSLREQCPHTKVVATSVKPEHKKEARGYGVDGFLSK